MEPQLWWCQEVERVKLKELLVIEVPQLGINSPLKLEMKKNVRDLRGG